jgi:hypothetical protein
MDEQNLQIKASLMLEQIGNIISSLRNKKGWTYGDLAKRANEVLPEKSVLVYEGHTIMLMEAGVEIIPEGHIDLEDLEKFSIEGKNFENAIWPVLEVLGVIHLFPLITKDDTASIEPVLKI